MHRFIFTIIQTPRIFKIYERYLWLICAGILKDLTCTGEANHAVTALGYTPKLVIAIVVYLFFVVYQFKQLPV